MERKELMESLASLYPTLKFEEGISQLLTWDWLTEGNTPIPELIPWLQTRMS